MLQQKNIVYLIGLGVSVLVSLKASISYALLNIFISEKNLPLELGIAKIIGEQGALVVNIIIDTLIWFVILIVGYGLYKHLGRKKFIVFLILSPILWLVGSYAIILVDIFVFGNFTINIFGSCPSSGYPIYREACLEDVLYALYFLNILFWFLVVWFTWEQLLKKTFHLHKN